MGTNFYFSHYGYDEDEERGQHIGKRSAAGYYCWDCKTTLCEDGILGVHHGKNFFDKCPLCGKVKKEESLSKSSAGRELGFNKTAPRAKTGVRSCSSFTWAINPAELDNFPKRKKLIQNEYGDRFTLAEFLQILQECPIQFFDLIGKEFS